MKDTMIIAFAGAPGSGKTSMCSLLFAEFKLRGLSVEYVPEIAKSLVWTKQFDLLNNQHYVSTKQYELFKAVYGKVDFILTDGPLLHGIYYNRHNDENICNIEKVESILLKMLGDFKHIYINVKRGDFPYEKEGRLQSSEESDTIGVAISNIMNDLNITYHTILSGRSALSDICMHLKSQDLSIDDTRVNR